MSLPGNRQPEWKYIDNFNKDVILPLTPTPILLNGLAPGSGASQRIGTQIDIMTVELRLTWTVGGSTTPGHVRVMMCYDKQTNATAPALTDILENGATIAPTSALRLMSNRRRFKIIMDRTFSHGALSTGEATGDMYFYGRYKRRPIVTQYNAGTAGTVGDIVTNALYLLIFAEASTNNPTCDYYARVRYVDT